MVCPEHANHHGLRSQEPNRGPGARRVAETPGVPLCDRGGAGFRDSRNPAAQRIHLFQVLGHGPDPKGRVCAKWERVSRKDHLMNTARNNLLRFLCASGLIIVLAAALNFVVDPLQLFRPARLFAAMYSPDSRMQDAGLIRSHDIDRLLGVRSVKLAMTGSNSLEQSFVLAAALERRPRRVIWQMDDWIFHDAPDIDHDIYLPADLYRRNAKGIAEYLFSGAMARESLWIVARSIPPLEPLVARLTTGMLFKFPVSRVDDINTLRPDFDVAGFYNAKKALAAFTRITDPVRSTNLAEGYDYDAMVRVFEQDAISLIEKNPEVKFDIYFAPYSILQFVAMRDASPATLKAVYDFSAYALPRLTQFPNVTFHDFRVVGEITHDLNNYGDVIHHSPSIDLKVLSLLAEGKYAVDRTAPTASLDRLKAQVEAYRIDNVERYS